MQECEAIIEKGSPILFSWSDFLLTTLLGVVDTVADFLSAQAVIGVVALYIAYNNYYRKSGVNIRAGIGRSSSIVSTGMYVSSIVLENMKDKSVTLYHICMEFDGTHLLELEDLSENPVVMKPYETLVRSYEPAYAYSVNAMSVSVDRALGDRKIRKKVVLSTNEGRYVAKEIKNLWTPVGALFSHRILSIVRPYYIDVDGINIGLGVRYILEINRGGDVNYLFIYKSQGEFRRYGLILNEKDVLTVDNVRSKIEEQQALGEIPEDVTINVYTVDDFTGDALNWFRGKKTHCISKEDMKPRYYPLRFMTLLKKRSVRIWYGERGRAKQGNSRK